MNIDTVDKLGKPYWDDLWTGNLPAMVDPLLPGLASYVNRAQHRFFTKVINGITPRPVRLLEIGCANSGWLPYFARQFGLEVWGVDYSEVGCERAREILARAGIAGRVVCANLFDPPADMVGRFDILASFGVVEHFEDTAGCLRACARFLKPGGVMITTIPNLRGIPGWLQKRIDRRIYDGHMALDRAQIIDAHCDAGLIECEAVYFLGVNLSALNLRGVRPRIVRRIGGGICHVISAGFWMLEERGLRVPPSKATSPFIFCVAKKPRIVVDDAALS